MGSDQFLASCSPAVNKLPTRCGYEVSGMILLRNLKGAMRLDRSKDISTHQLRFQRIDSSCVEVVALIIRVCFYVSSQKRGSVFRATN
jgi:hypothetical protein